MSIEIIILVLPVQTAGSWKYNAYARCFFRVKHIKQPITLAEGSGFVFVLYNFIPFKKESILF